MAITACAAKVSANSICLSVNGSMKPRINTARRGFPSRSNGTPKVVCTFSKPGTFVIFEFWVGLGVFDLHSLTHAENAANDRSMIRFAPEPDFVHVLVLLGRIAVACDVVEMTIPGEFGLTLCQHGRVAPPNSTSVSNTACKSNAERLMTLSTSPVAASRSRASSAHG